MHTYQGMFSIVDKNINYCWGHIINYSLKKICCYRVILIIILCNDDIWCFNVKGTGCQAKYVLVFKVVSDKITTKVLNFKNIIDPLINVINEWAIRHKLKLETTTEN